MDLWSLESGLRRCVLVKPEFVAVAGDLASGTMLSQIIYWCRPDKTGASKLRVRRDGRAWIAKTCEEWCAECSITEKQFRRVVRQLQALGFIERQIKRFHGGTMTHISLNEGVLFAALKSHLGDVANEPSNL